MKKIFSLALSLILVATVCVTSLFACTNSAFDTYFKEFTSTEGFSALVPSLTLPEEVFVDGYYEKSDRFVIKKKTGLKDDKNQDVYLYGIASRTEVLLPPSFLQVHDISGDYAIVSRMTLDENSQIQSSFGLIKIFDKNLYSDMTTFQHRIASEDYLPIRFSGNYIAIFADRYASGTADKFTFYDYEMNVVFLLSGTIFTEFAAQENYVIAYPDSSRAQFYKADKKDSDGFLIKTDEYAPFSETDISSRQYEIIINYLGNGWFLRTATVSAQSSFSGYNIKLNDNDQYSYQKKISDRYSADAKTAYNNQTLLPVLAVNQYNNDEMRDLATYYNQIAIPSVEDKKPVYQFPVYPTSEIIKEGYTMVYTYYYIDEATKAVDVSFAILDGTAKAPTILKDVYMPLLFVDGVGFEVDSPYFSPTYYQAGTFDKKGKLSILENSVEDVSYAAMRVHHGGMSIVSRIDLLTMVEEQTYKAYSGTTVAVPHGRYGEFTPYFSGIATASRYDKTAKKRIYYSVNQEGGETVLQNVYNLKNGVFVTEQTSGDTTLFGLTTNSGIELLSGRQSIQIYELFLKGGKFLQSMVYTQENNRGVIYSLQ